MRLSNFIVTVVSLVGFAAAAPLDNSALESLNSPATIFDSKNNSDDCTKGPDCGSFKLITGELVPIKEGICMPVPEHAYTVYTGHCLCILWSTCETNYVGGMYSCELRTLSDYQTRSRYITCSGRG